MPLVFAIVAGCGQRVPHGHLPWCRATISVRAGETPLTRGQVDLIADATSGGVDAGGLLDDRGMTSFDVLPGRYKVIVRPLSLSPDEADRAHAGGKRLQSTIPIPARFQSVAKTPLDLDVVAGTKPTLSIELESKTP